MKKTISLFVCLVFLFCINAHAYDVKYGNYYFNKLALTSSESVGGVMTYHYNVEATSKEGGYSKFAQIYSGAIAPPATFTTTDIVNGETVTNIYTLTKIGVMAFANNASATEIIIPETVTEMSDMALMGNHDIKKLTCLATTPPSYGTSFLLVPYEIASVATLYVPIGSKSAYASANGWRIFSDIKEVVPSLGDHDYVDLGLPSGKLWATCNLGATSPSGYGTYITMNSTDQVKSSWGSYWATPTRAEYNELVNYCTWSWQTKNGVSGYKLTGPNGNTMFLPAAGFQIMGVGQSVGSNLYYWTQTPSSESGFYYMLTGSNASYRTNNTYNASIMSAPVRPICTFKPDVKVTSITLSSNSLDLTEGEKATLTVTVLPNNATNKNVTWSSSNSSVASVSSTGVVTAIAEGSATITIKANDGSNTEATCQISVQAAIDHSKEYVDLGLPSGKLWAICNLGAKSPSEYGTYVSINSIDQVKSSWGDDWATPTRAEYDELLNNCTWTWETMNGVLGYKVTGSNGNSIFLPAAGFLDSGNEKSVGSKLYYWTRTSPGIGISNLLYGSSSICGIIEGNQLLYAPIRPINTFTPDVKVASITLSTNTLYLIEGEKVSLTARILPNNATSQNVTWSSSNPSVASVSSTGKVTAISEGSATITVKANDGSKVEATCQITVEADIDHSKEYVDLGLPSGLLWAVTNVGAKRAEDYGDYFAWGETVPKSDYSWETYKYANGSGKSLTKYCTDVTYGDVDNKEQLKEEDDAATMNWGKPWRTPTLVETQELITYCSWAKTTQKGVNGYSVTGPNGNSIFLPSTGVKQYNGTSYSDRACVQTSILFNATNGEPSSASVLCCEDIKPHWWYGWDRCWGYTVRPVMLPESLDITVISDIKANEIEGIYSINGIKIKSLQKGINIIKFKNGKSKTVMK